MPDFTPNPTGGAKHPMMDDPRLPLAVERTFLAWIRTGLSLMGFGFVVARFGLFLHELSWAQGLDRSNGHGVSVWLGTALVLLGVILNAAALLRYKRYQRLLKQGIIPGPGIEMETTVALSLIVLGLASVAYLLYLAWT